MPFPTLCLLPQGAHAALTQRSWSDELSIRYRMELQISFPLCLLAKRLLKFYPVLCVEQMYHKSHKRREKYSKSVIKLNKINSRGIALCFSLRTLPYSLSVCIIEWKNMLPHIINFLFLLAFASLYRTHVVALLQKKGADSKFMAVFAAVRHRKLKYFVCQWAFFHASISVKAFIWILNAPKVTLGWNIYRSLLFHSHPPPCSPWTHVWECKRRSYHEKM